ncbi:MAG: hypothetical protein ABSF67_12820 [Roseiarcus sp.]
MRVALSLAPWALLDVVAASPPIPTQLAALVAILGVAVERWLFLAEAQYVSVAFYVRAS